MYVCKPVYMYVCVCLCVCVYIYIYIYIYLPNSAFSPMRGLPGVGAYPVLLSPKQIREN